MLTQRLATAAVSFVLPCLALLSGCQAPVKASRSSLFFPSPPDRPRVQFLTWASGSEQVAAGYTPLDVFLLGEAAIDRRTIQKPYGVAARDGVVYVCDTKGLALIALDFKNEAYSVLGISGPGRLQKPLNVVIDNAGYKFVVDSNRKQVVVFAPDNQYVTAFTIPEPCHPVDIAIHKDELYVLDNDATPQIVVLDRRTGELIRSFGSSGREPGQFHIPSSLCIGPKGDLYVSDTMNWRIQKLTLEGEPIWERGAAGYFAGQFGRPRGIRVGPDDVIYVVDGASEVVQMFNSDGEALMFMGGPGDLPGALVLPSSLCLDSTSIPYFKKYIHKAFNVEYLVFVANQYGPRLINVYAFGSFPEGYQLAESQIASLPARSEDEGIGPVSGALPPPADAGSEEKREPSERPH